MVVGHPSPHTPGPTLVNGPADCSHGEKTIYISLHGVLPAILNTFANDKWVGGGGGAISDLFGESIIQNGPKHR